MILSSIHFFFTINHCLFFVRLFTVIACFFLKNYIIKLIVLSEPSIVNNSNFRFFLFF